MQCYFCITTNLRFIAEYESYYERLHNKIVLLLEKHQQLKDDLKVSNERVDVLSKQLGEQNQTIHQLNEKNKVLKLSIYSKQTRK